MKKKDITVVASLGGVVLLLFVVFFWVNTRTQERSVVLAPESEELPPIDSSLSLKTAPAAPQAPNKKKRPAQSKTKFDKYSDEEIAYSPEEDQLGIRKKKLQKTPKGGALLRFSLVSEKRCMIGDIDVIKKDLEYSPNPTLLLTIESLIPGDESFSPLVKKISAEQLKNGFAMNFSIPESVETHHLGLFLCNDLSDENHCFSKVKEVGELNEVYASYLRLEKKIKMKKLQNDPLSTEIPETVDRIYFFNYLLLSGSEISVLDNEMPEKKYGELQNYLDTSAYSGHSLEIVKQVKHLNTTLKSVSVDVEGKKMTLNFPVFDIYQCEVTKKALKSIKQMKKERKEKRGQ